MMALSFIPSMDLVPLWPPDCDNVAHSLVGLKMFPSRKTGGKNLFNPKKDATKKNAWFY